MRSAVARGALVVGLLVAALAGCGFTPADVPSSSAIPPGPGLFTGSAGELVILGGSPPGAQGRR